MKLDAFLPSVLPSVPGCPDLLAIDYVRRAAREFAGGTLCWNYTLPVIPAEAGAADYTLQLPDGQELVRVLLVEVDGEPYEVPYGPIARQRLRRGVGGQCVMQGAQDFSLSPAPSIDGTEILTDVAVRPTLASNYWPDDLSEYQNDIAAGAIGMLAMLPKQPWTDDKTAAAQGALFADRKSIVALKIQRAFSNSAQRKRVVWF
ncbi:MAG TPA: hypothetical protein VNU71_13520 [Burkholderiaceae bacterium]|nr:hypothetical protein [Burkholderiaceae bacterium]